MIDVPVRSDMPARRAGRRAALLLALSAAPAARAAAQPTGLVTVPSAHALRPTLDRFAAAVRGEGWVVFGEIDHAAAADRAGLTLAARTVVLFGNPRAGTGAMAETPTLALDLPMRVLVWEDAAGRVQVTRSTGADIAERVFARHGIVVPAAQRAGTDALLARLVTAATR